MEFLSVILTAAVIDNFCLTKFLGFNEATESKTSVKDLGIAVTLMTTVCALVCSLVNTTVLEAFGLGYLKTLAFVVIVLVVGALCKMVLGGKFADDSFTAVVTANSAVLGTCLVTASMTAVEAACTGLGAGLGIMLAMYVLKGINDNMNEKDLPAAFRGVPAQILAAGIMAMAFFAFK